MPMGGGAIAPLATGAIGYGAIAPLPWLRYWDAEKEQSFCFAIWNNHSSTYFWIYYLLVYRFCKQGE